MPELDITAYLQHPQGYALQRLRRFVTKCFAPAVFYDVGANDPFSAEGQQTIYKPLLPDTVFYLFEAAAKHEAALFNSEEEYAIVLLGETEGAEKTFYETDAFAPGTGDSYYRERTAAYDPEVLRASRRTTRRLDSVVAERGWSLPDFIKLDTQGSELDILRGAPRCLANARGLQIECNVVNYNAGAPLMPEVMAFALDNGFRIYDFVQFHFGAQADLLQVDAIFVRRELFGERW